MYKNLETLLVTASNGKEFEEHLKLVRDFYGTDLTQLRLKAQLEILATHFQQAEHNSNVSFKDIKSFLQGLTISTHSLFSEVITLMQLVLVLPAKNAMSKHSFLAMRRGKNYLCSTMGQERFNHLMVLHVHKSITDSLDIIQVANDFVSCNEHWEHVFGMFMSHDLV